MSFFLLHILYYCFIFAEPFLEALPQLFVQLTIFTLSFDEKKDGYGIINPYGYKFLITVSLSILSATFGLTKFFKDGPCQLVPQNYGCGFFTVMFIILINLLTKAAQFCLFISLYSNLTNGILTWLCWFVLPHIIYVRKYY